MNLTQTEYESLVEHIRNARDITLHPDAATNEARMRGLRAATSALAHFLVSHCQSPRFNGELFVSAFLRETGTAWQTPVPMGNGPVLFPASEASQATDSPGSFGSFALDEKRTSAAREHIALARNRDSE